MSPRVPNKFTCLVHKIHGPPSTFSHDTKVFRSSFPVRRFAKHLDFIVPERWMNRGTTVRETGTSSVQLHQLKTPENASGGNVFI